LETADHTHKIAILQVAIGKKRLEKLEFERRVSDYIRDLPFLWVNVANQLVRRTTGRISNGTQLPS
jgi:hypothetical protein